MGARDGEKEDFLQGACSTSASTMFALLCSSIFSLPCFDCRTREQVLMHSLRNDGESWSLRDNSLQLAIDGTLGEARVHACKWSRFHISIEAQTVQSTLARIRASAPPAHHKVAEASKWSTQPHMSAANADVLSPVVVCRTNTSRTGSFPPALRHVVLLH